MMTVRRTVMLSAAALTLVAARVAIVLNPTSIPASIVMVTAAILLAGLLGAPAADDTVRPPRVVDSAPRRVIGTVAGSLGLGMAVLGAWWLAENWTANFDRAGPLVVGGLTLWSIGLATDDRRAHGFTWGREAMSSGERLAVLGLVVLSFALRFYRFAEFPPPEGICAIEETQMGQQGWQILHGARPWEYLLDGWLAALGLRLGGINLTALRVPFAIVSALTVLPLYWLLRCLVSRTVATTTAFMFAVCHWHLVYARYAHNIYATTFIVVVLLYLMIRARWDGRLAIYPWIGFLAGYTLYTYSGYRGTSVFVLLFLGGAILADFRASQAAVEPAQRRARRAQLQRQLTATGLAAVGFAVAALPLLVITLREPDGVAYYLDGASRSLADSEYYGGTASNLIQLRLARVREAAMIFNHVGDQWPTMNLPGTPMLDPATGALFTVGLIWCLLHPRRRFAGLFVAMFLVLLLVGTVFVHNFDVRRLQGIIPLIFVMIALLLDRVETVIGARGRPVFIVMLGLIVVVAGVRNVDVYFRQMMHSPLVRRLFHNPYTVAITYLHRLPERAHVVLLAGVPNFFNANDYEWWRGDRVTGVATSDLYSVLTRGAPATRGRELYVLMTEPYEVDDLTAALRARYPGTTCESVDAPDGAPLHFTSCRLGSVEALPAAKASGFRARYFRGDESEPFLDRVEPFVSYALTPDVCHPAPDRPAPPCRVVWTGLVDVPTSLSLVVETRSAAAELRVDGVPVEGSVRLGSGSHVIQIDALLAANELSGVHLLGRSDPDGQLTLLNQW